MYDFELGLCALEYVKDATFSCIMRLQADESYNFIVRQRMRDAVIGRSRSVVASQFLEAKQSDVLQFVDTDMVFTPDDIQKLLEAQKAGYDIVGGATLMANGMISLRTFDRQPAVIHNKGDICEVEYVSSGFMSISRKALEQIRDELHLPVLYIEEKAPICYPFFESVRDWTGRHSMYLSEDWDFCEKARKAGLKVYWHTGVLVGHLKDVLLLPSIDELLKEAEDAKTVGKNGKAKVQGRSGR